MDSSYSLSEMKTFKKMAKAIRNVYEREGHSEATAAFIDAEFSDNAGRTVKALKANNSWKKQRVNTICEKAARIMEDRYANSLPVSRLIVVPPHQGPLVPPRRFSFQPSAPEKITT